MTVNQFLKAIKEQKEGFSFGKPWRYSKDSLFAVLPIVRKSRVQRDYITLSEAKKVKIEDSGQINKVLIANNNKDPLFIRAGEIFKGQTQERAAILSRIVMPKEAAEIEVVCVHQTKGIFTGAAMAASGFTPAGIEMSLYEDTARREDANDIYQNIQANAWNNVASYSVRGASINQASTSQSGGPSLSTPSDDLVESMRTFSKSIEEVIKAVPKIDWQTGLALISVDGVEAIECFNLADSWTAVHEAVISKENETLAKYLQDQDSIFEYKSGKVEGITQKALGLNFVQKDLFKDKDSRTISLKAGDYLGEATMFKNKIIHLALTRKKD